MTSINFKVIGLTRQGSENSRSGFEPATFRFPNLPELEADALTHLATLTGCDVCCVLCVVCGVVCIVYCVLCIVYGDRDTI